MHRFPCRLAWLLLALWAAPVEAGHPLLTYWARESNGPYAPQIGRYAVVDPVPVAAAAPTSHHANPVDAPRELWQRRDLAPTVYPYGWFGAAPHASNSWTHTYYYDNYRDYRVLRGR
jgi:hypothetical protein